jgi:hypothetical protein
MVLNVLQRPLPVALGDEVRALCRWVERARDGAEE